MEKTRATKLQIEDLELAKEGYLSVNDTTYFLINCACILLEVARANREISYLQYQEYMNVLRKIQLKRKTLSYEASTRKEVVTFHNKVLNNLFVVVGVIFHDELMSLADVLNYKFANFRIGWYWKIHPHSSIQAELKFIKELFFSNKIEEI